MAGDHGHHDHHPAPTGWRATLVRARHPLVMGTVAFLCAYLATRPSFGSRFGYDLQPAQRKVIRYDAEAVAKAKSHH